MNIYQEELLDHYENPSNYGTLPNPDISHEEDNPLCGDKIRMDLLVEDDTIKEVRFSGTRLYHQSSRCLYADRKD